MAKKTNKTSHVLNLITNGDAEMPSEAKAPADVQEENSKKTSDKVSSDAKVTVINTDVENSEVSQEIQKQLLNQLAEEQKADEVDSEMGINNEETKEIDDISTVQMEESVNVEVKTESGALPEEETAVPEKVTDKPQEENTYKMVNVMEKILQRTDILKQMKEYDVCTCSRCRADLQALVLTRLPAKYVVIDQTAANPMISYYESRYRMRILTEMIKSCIDVRENPRH